MFQQQARIINTFLMAIDAMCIILAGYSAFYARRFFGDGLFTMPIEVFTASLLLVMVINNYVMGRMALYSDKKFLPCKKLLWQIFKVIVIDFSALSTAIVLFKQTEFSRAFLLMFASFSFFFIFLMKILAQAYLHQIGKNGFSLHNLLIVGSSQRAEVVKEILEKQLSWGHKVIGRLALEPEIVACPDCMGTAENLPQILRHNEIDEVVFAFDGNKSIDLSQYLQICRKMGVQVRILPALWQEGDPNISIEHCQEVPFITIKTDNIDARGLLYKRVMDVIGGLVGSLLFLILYPIVGIAIKLESAGPIIFKQKRVGQHGRLFNLYKFRSMYQDAEKMKSELNHQNVMEGAMFKLPNDPRITKVGKWLRKLSLDEFPQFLNVLKGEMSLVGTRPPTPDEVQMYMPEHLRRISAKPGITGLWQVSGRNQIKEFEKVVELDVRYLDNWRFSDDLIILVKTIFVVLKRKGAI